MKVHIISCTEAVTQWERHYMHMQTSCRRILSTIPAGGASWLWWSVPTSCWCCGLEWALWGRPEEWGTQLRRWSRNRSSTFTGNTVLSRVSAHLRVSTHPSFLMILWFTYYVYMRYTYKWLVCVSAHPNFWPINFKRPWVLTRENTVCSRVFVLWFRGWFMLQFKTT